MFKKFLKNLLCSGDFERPKYRFFRRDNRPIQKTIQIDNIDNGIRDMVLIDIDIDGKVIGVEVIPKHNMKEP